MARANGPASYCSMSKPGVPEAQQNADSEAAKEWASKHPKRVKKGPLVSVDIELLFPSRKMKTILQ
jgi:hypothetical protein